METETSQVIAERVVSHLTDYTLSCENVDGEIVVNTDFEQKKKMYDLLYNFFNKENDERALGVLENFKRDPAEYRTNLQNKLIEKQQSNPRLARDLNNMLQQFPVQEILVRNQSTAQGNKMINSLGRGTQRIEADHNSQVNNSSMEIL